MIKGGCQSVLKRNKKISDVVTLGTFVIGTSLLLIGGRCVNLPELPGTALISGTDRNGLLLIPLPAQFLVISIQYTRADQFQVLYL